MAGENGQESVFEIQYTEDPTSDYGEGAGFTRGTFTVILTRSRSSQLGGGWGFNHPTQNLYDEYEEGDSRRDVTILDPTGYMENESQEIYLGSRYLNRKYALINGDDPTDYYELTHATRGPINNKQIRYADVLLMYAEAAEAQANASSVKPTRKKIEFVLDSIRYCQDCLRLKIKLRSRFTFGQALFQLKREQITLRDVIALFIFEHQDIAQQTEQQLLKKLDDLLITQDMMRKFTEENASY